MERTRYIAHRGHRILVLDYTGIHDSDSALKAIEESKREVARHPPGSLLIITLVHDARYNATTLQAMKELAAHNRPFVKASAIVGMTGLHRIAYQAVILFSRRNVPPFETEQQALDYLVDQAEAK